MARKFLNTRFSAIGIFTSHCLEASGSGSHQNVTSSAVEKSQAELYSYDFPLCWKNSLEMPVYNLRILYNGPEFFKYAILSDWLLH